MWSSLDVVVNKFQRWPGVSKTYLERQVKSIVQEESHGDAKKAAMSRAHCFPKISELLFINHFLTENHLPLSYWWPLGAEAHPGPWSGELCFLMQTTSDSISQLQASHLHNAWPLERWAVKPNRFWNSFVDRAASALNAENWRELRRGSDEAVSLDPASVIICGIKLQKRINSSETELWEFFFKAALDSTHSTHWSHYC